jgi:chorismate synthase
MAGNTFGEIFRITTFGESHGHAIGAVIDGCPAGLEVDTSYIQRESDKRKPGKSPIHSARSESDQVKIISGVYEGKTLGSPITLLINNEDHNSRDYDIYKSVYRPSHADYTYQLKYGIRDHRGGGRSSARETAARVAAGAIARLLLAKENISIYAYTDQIGNIKLNKHYSELDLESIYKNDVRCPDEETALNMHQLIDEVRQQGDSIGGVVFCVVKNCPSGLGEPVFDKLEADLAKAMLSINASKGFEIGSGFSAATMKGSEHNDVFALPGSEQAVTLTNNSGGVQGGISNGADIYFRVCFKPTATISKKQSMLKNDGSVVEIEPEEGRHDPCVATRAVTVVEAMAAIVVADHLLRNKLSRI